VSSLSYQESTPKGRGFDSAFGVMACPDAMNLVKYIEPFIALFR
jgi:hypothetical protein